MVQRANNPRVFAETISIDAWRTPFDGKTAEADLHIDAGFSKGRVGGPGAPIRFRLSLKRAEIQVILDLADVLVIPPSSVMRAPFRQVEVTKYVESRRSIEGEARASLTELSARGQFAAKGSIEIAETRQRSATEGDIFVDYRKIEHGYSFAVEASTSSRLLLGRPWDPLKPLLRVRDTRALRQRGEPPEPRIEVRCRREDLFVEDVEFTDKRKYSWSNLTRLKKLVVEQYIKDELAKVGFLSGDLSDPFESILLSDAVPFIES